MVFLVFSFLLTISPSTRNPIQTLFISFESFKPLFPPSPRPKPISIFLGMAPKKAVAKRSKRSRASPEQERRSKMRTDPLAPFGEEPVVGSRAGESSRQPAIAPTSIPRQIGKGRRIDFDFLRSENFYFGDLLKEQGWEYFCTLNVLTYPNLVREFYASLRSDITTLEGTVKGKKIILTAARLARILRMPSEGDFFEKFTFEERADALKWILGREEVEDLGELLANKLSVEMRFLHHMMCRLFFPKTGRYDWVTERDLVVMTHIIQGRPLNLPAMMIRWMRDTKTKQKSCLPYGMVLTLVFSDSGVDFEGEPSEPLSRWDVYDQKSLLRMGFNKVGDTWRSKAAETVHSHDDPTAVPTDLPEPGSPAIPGSPSAAGPSATSSAQTAAPVLTEDIIQRIADSVVLKIASGPLADLRSELKDDMTRLRADMKEDLNALLGKIEALESKEGEIDKSDINLLYSEAEKLKKKVDLEGKEMVKRMDLLGTAQHIGYEAILSKVLAVEGKLEFLFGARAASPIHPPPRSPSPVPSSSVPPQSDIKPDLPPARPRPGRSNPAFGSSSRRDL